MVEIYYNDPSVEISGSINLPDVLPCPKYTVIGYTGNPGLFKTLQYHAMVAEICIRNTINTFQNISNNQLTAWADTSNLTVYPHAGRMLNAYYDRKSLKFFYDKNMSGNGIVFTVESPDIVSHELGHAILDSLRPDLWNVQSIETMAFHESFGDIMAIIVGLMHDKVIDYISNETHGDLRKSNVITRIAEELGSAIYKRTTPLRDAVNDFVYAPPETLPRNLTMDKLSSEPHSFSRVFTGAFWDIFVNVFDEQKKIMSIKDSIFYAREVCLGALITGIKNAAVKSRFLESVASAMMFDLRIKPFAESVFMNRKICDNLSVVNIIDPEIKKVKLSEEMDVPPVNPLYDVIVQIPGDEGSGIAEESHEATKQCLDYLYENNKVGEEKEFKVVNNELKRNFICCCGGGKR